MGHNKALIAVGHKILVAIYHMLSQRQPYMAATPQQQQQKQQQKQKENLVKKLKEIGYKAELTLIENT
jgi:transposase